MNIPNLPILQLDFCLEANNRVTLPPYLGSTLRGAFGQHALKKAVCFVPHHDCNNCWFAKTCLYQQIYESPNFYTIPEEKTHPKLRNNAYFPSPFLLIPPTLIKTSKENLNNSFSDFNHYFKPNIYQKGDELSFSIRLFGNAVNYWNYVLVAVRLLAENGLGEHDKRTPFTLKQALVNGILIFENENSTVLTNRILLKTLSELVSERLNNVSDKDSIGIDFQTPIHIEKEKKRLDKNPTFFKIVQKISERIEFLEFLYGGSETWTDYRPFLENAKVIEIKNKSIQSYKYKQFSREEAIIVREVFLGKMNFQGKQITKYLPLLLAGEILNLGSDTTHGFGRIKIKF